MARKADCLLQVDGGINAANAVLLKEAGADLFVVGTSLFNAEDIEETDQEILKSNAMESIMKKTILPLFAHGCWSCADRLPFQERHQH